MHTDNDLGIKNNDIKSTNEEISESYDNILHMETEERVRDSVENEERVSLGEAQ